MAKKATLSPITGSPISQIAAINSALDDINDRLDNTLSRDGSTPNTMEADFDLNSNDIINGGIVNSKRIVLDGVELFPGDIGNTIYNQGGVGAVNRSIVSKLQEVISVKDFGATGDGSTDDADAIQAAFTYWWNEGGKVGSVYFPTGTYRTTKSFFTDAIIDGLWSSSQGTLAIKGDGVSTIIKPDYTPRGLRTAGKYVGLYAEIPLIEWVNPSKRGYLYMHDLNFQGNQDIVRDPIILKGINVNQSSFYNLDITELKNAGISIESINNSRFSDIRLRHCGYQPTNESTSGFLTETVTFSIDSGDTEIRSTEDVFVSGDVGKWFCIAMDGGRPLISKIATYNNARSVELTDTAASTVTGQAGSFGIVTGSMTAGSATLTLDASVATSDLRGALICVYGAGYNIGDQGEHNLIARITNITSPTSCTLAAASLRSVSNVPIIFMPAMMIGFSSDTLDDRGNNNDTMLWGIRSNHTNTVNRGVVQLLTQGTFGMNITDSKFHGTPESWNNFGGNAFTEIYDHCKYLTLKGVLHEWGWYSGDYGQRVLCGGRIDYRDTNSSFSTTQRPPTKVIFVSIDGDNSDDMAVDVTGHINTSGWTEDSNNYLFKFLNQGSVYKNVHMSGPVFVRDTGETIQYSSASQQNTNLLRLSKNNTIAPELTIASGAITVTSSYHRVDTEGDAASDDLDTINGGTNGQILVLRSANSSREVVVRNNVGNIRCGSARSLSHGRDTISFIYDGEVDTWTMLSFADNAV